jgi:hypothetical protein
VRVGNDADPERHEDTRILTARAVSRFIGLPHSAASTVLLYSSAKSIEYEPHLRHFASLITFEDIFARFPALSV